MINDEDFNVMKVIPFNKPFMTGRELGYIKRAHENGILAGDGTYTKMCHNWLEEYSGARKVLLTHSCTAALEMSAILINTRHGDEIIMPSFTFVSTANPFVLRGGVPVFVDIRRDTLNIDERLIENAITKKTKAIVVVHYAGVACEMDTIMQIARKHDLIVIEDAAQGIGGNYKGQPLGSIGDLGTYSFHETKNIISGEGGALLINNEKFVERSEIIREKGTNRSQFFRGQVDKYTWVDIGSSYLPSEIVAAFLWAQLEACKLITERRMTMWQTYNSALSKLCIENCQTPSIASTHFEHNAHIYYLILNTFEERNLFITKMRELGIHCVFHYIPLHSAKIGEKVGRVEGKLNVTDSISSRLVRLPLWIGLEEQLPFIIDSVKKVLNEISIK